MTVSAISFCGTNVDMKERLLTGNPFVIAARHAAKRGVAKDAEMRYRQALNFCRKHNGKRSAAYGLVLFELSDFFEEQERVEDVEQCWVEIRQILTVFYNPERSI